MTRASRGIALAALLTCLVGDPALAGRETVLKQVDLPHNYYWRELYIPQLTTGPSAVDFMPDGENLVYSMGGSLWRQRADSREAVELTHATGAYDFQPDVAPDGRSVVFSRYDGDGIELWRLDLASGAEQALTRGGDVNVEPRLSPDGSRLAWVSTAGTGHFNLMVADIGAGGLGAARPLVLPRKSEIDRYYYSAFDHALNPSWSPDGERVYYVGNREVAWGTGDLHSVSARDPADIKKVLSEETSWNARPEPSPDGRRVLYSSYHGRQWQQLWLTTPDGAAPLPLTFGEFDRRNARWSPDGKRIAYISNEHGNTSLVVQDVVGGAQKAVVPSVRRYRQPQAILDLTILGPRGEPVPARVSVIGSDSRAYAPDDAWMHADDGFDRARQKTETHYFHCAPPCKLSVPAGSTAITVRRGFRHLPWTRTIELGAAASRDIEARLQANELPAQFGTYLSADLHVHMNYGGHYRSDPERLALQARAEDLDAVHNLIVNKEERFPDIAGFDTSPHPAGGKDVLLLHGQEYHTSYWGHMGLLHLQSLLLPGFSSYRHTALASPYPHNGVIADLAHAQGALVGYAHPYDWEIVPAKERALTHMLPADAVLGKVDYVEVAGFADHKATSLVWHRLLNLGLRLPAGGASDGMGNYASLHGPIGLTRTFLDTRVSREPAAFHEALKRGRTFVSNGPLLGLELAGAHPGDTLAGRAAGNTPFRIAMRSPVPVDHLELVYNGAVLRSFKLSGERLSLDASGVVPLDRGGWLVLRAWNEGADPAVLDLYPFATTSPVYVDLPGAPRSRGEDAAYFVAWLDRVIESAQQRDDYNNEEERRETLAYLRKARERFLALR